MQIKINEIADKIEEHKEKEKVDKQVSSAVKPLEPENMVKAEKILKQIRTCKAEMKRALLNELIEILPQEKLDSLMVLANYLNVIDKKDKDYILTSMVDKDVIEKDNVEVDFKQLYVMLKNGVPIKEAAKTLGISVKGLLEHIQKYEQQLKDFKFFQQNKTDNLEYLQFRIFQTLSDKDILKISPAQRITMLGILQDKIRDNKNLNRGKLNIEINIEQIQESKKKAFIDINSSD